MVSPRVRHSRPQPPAKPIELAHTQEWADARSPSAKKVDAFLFKSLGGLIEQLNDCLQLGCL